MTQNREVSQWKDQDAHGLGFLYLNKADKLASLWVLKDDWQLLGEPWKWRYLYFLLLSLPAASCEVSWQQISDHVTSPQNHLGLPI